MIIMITRKRRSERAQIPRKRRAHLSCVCVCGGGEEIKKTQRKSIVDYGDDDDARGKGGDYD